MSNDQTRIAGELDKIALELPDALSLAANPGPADPIIGRRRVDDWRLVELGMRADALARQAGIDPDKVAGSKAKRTRDEEGLSDNLMATHRKIKALHGAISKSVESS